jgi:tripartite-type tricarboxylate transporter receptor subunit TctC
MARVPLVFAVNANLRATTIEELITAAKERPGAMTYGSSGMVSRFATEMLKASARIDVLEIPYKSVPAALHDLLSGRIDMMFFDLSIVAPHVKAGTVRLLGAAGGRRPAGAPDVPTFAELGVRDLRAEPWFGLVAPSRTPPEILAKLRRLPEIQRSLGQLGYEPIDDSPEQFSAELVGDIAKYSAIVKNAGIKGEPP